MNENRRLKKEHSINGMNAPHRKQQQEETEKDEEEEENEEAENETHACRMTVL